jgi:hypothetical protein
LSLRRWLFGRHDAPEPRLHLADGAEEGWEDCAFEATRNGDRIAGRALYDGEIVGLAVQLPSHWERPALEPDSPFSGWRGTITLCSRGRESDRFVQVLADRYQVAALAARMVPSVSCTGITLTGDPAAIGRTSVSVKLFFAEDDAERYAEAFLNLRLPAGRLELNEKDEEYRAPLIRALVGS